MYYAEELARGGFAALYDCLRRDSRIYGSKKALYWLVRFGFFPLLPLSIQQGLRRLTGRPPEAYQDSYWLTPAMRSIIDQRSALHKQRLKIPECSIVQRELFFTLSASAIADIFLQGDDRLCTHSGIISLPDKTGHPGSKEHHPGYDRIEDLSRGGLKLHLIN